MLLRPVKNTLFIKKYLLQKRKRTANSIVQRTSQIEKKKTMFWNKAI